MGDDDDASALMDERVERSHRGANTTIVRDLTVTQRHVQITTDDDALARQ
jgi:hypothetical protein